METTNPFPDWIDRRRDIEQRLAAARRKWHDDDYGELLRFLQEAKDRDDLLLESGNRISNFLERWPDSEYRAELTRWSADAQARIRRINERKAWEVLRQFLDQRYKGSEAEQRIQAIEQFLRDYPESNYKEDANGLKREAEIPNKRWQQFQALHSEWTRVQTECDNLVNKRDCESAIRKCLEFRSKCEEFQRDISSRNNYSEYGEALDRLIGLVNQTGDRYQWLGVLSYAAREPTNYEQIIQMAKHYKARNLFTNKRFDKEADKLIEKAGTEWDRREYEKVIKVVSEAINLPVSTNNMKRKTQAFEAAYKQARSYLENQCPIKKRRAAVQKWVNWFESINKPSVVVTVTIVEAEISKQAKTIWDPFDPPDVKITLRLDTSPAAGQIWTSPVVNNSYEPKYNHRCDGVQIGWDDTKAKLTLILTDEDTMYDDTLSITFEGPDVIFMLDDWIWVLDGAGRHRIYLACEALRPPALPMYEDNP